jgi:putative Holliday junction resolvase
MGTILALDYGLRRVGLAVSDSTRSLATALGAHDSRHDGSILTRLRALVAEREVELILVGLPLTADGREGGIAAKARSFADKLRTALELPVEMVDERYSSQEADRWLAASARRREKGQRDAVAAELILQQYLDGPAGGGS